MELAIDGYVAEAFGVSSTGDVDRLKGRREAEISSLLRPSFPGRVIPERPRRFEALSTNMNTQGLRLP